MALVGVVLMSDGFSGSYVLGKNVSMRFIVDLYFILFQDKLTTLE